MTYLDVANMTNSGSLLRRASAAAAQEADAGATLEPADPSEWAQDHRWELAAAPGWGDAWASAVAAGVTDPGADEGVITDGMILSEVQKVLGAPASTRRARKGS